jgi:large subunit ribosomal protein L21
MYAIVEIAGQQFKAEPGKKLYVHRLEGNEGDSISFDKVLLTDSEGAVKVGTPTVSGVKVNAKIVAHLKDDKVKIFKKKRRKGYKKTQGHRQLLTQISIESIG